MSVARNDWDSARRWPDRAAPRALVVAAFAGGADAVAASGPEIAAGLAVAGFHVLTLGTACEANAHWRLDLSRAEGVEDLSVALSNERFDLVALDPGAIFLRPLVGTVHRGVAARQLALICRLVRLGERLVLVGRHPAGVAPTRWLARAIVGLSAPAAVLDPDAPYRERRAALLGATGASAEDAAGERPAVDLARIGFGGVAPTRAARIAAAVRRAVHEGADFAAPDPPPDPEPICPSRLKAAFAPDHAWASVEGRPVTRLMTHLRAARHALPGLSPGGEAASRRLMDWYGQQARGSIESPLPALELFQGHGSEEAATARRLAAWWADLAERRGLDAPLAVAAVEDGEAARLASALAHTAKAIGNGAPVPALTAEVAALLDNPLESDPRSLSGLEFALALLSGAVPSESGSGWRCPDARRRFRGLCTRTCTTAGASPPSSCPELRVVGLTGTGNGSGLWANLGMSVAALESAGFDPVTRGHGVARRKPSAPACPGRALAAPVRLLHLNADRIPEALLRTRCDGGPSAVNIGFLLWEFETLPTAHRLALDMLDEAWCPTEFVASAYRATGRLPVHRVGKAVTLGQVEAAGRGAFGLPERDVVFLVAFDFHSSVERKNPLAAVRAFQRAFPHGTRGVSLVLKTTEVTRGHWGDPNGQWERILDIAWTDPRIRILDRRMALPRYFALLRAADCLVSPHRAEGFGYGPAQAMLLDRPSIVTDYSGTRDFCTSKTSFPVPAELVPVRQGEAIFPLENACWAAIDEAALAETMRRVAEDHKEAARRARAGRRLMERDYSIEAQAARYLQRLAELGVLAREAA